jgi:hypothetical protein
MMPGPLSSPSSAQDILGTTAQLQLDIAGVMVAVPEDNPFFHDKLRQAHFEQVGNPYMDRTSNYIRMYRSK